MNYWIPYKQISDNYKVSSIFSDEDAFFDYNSIIILKKLYEDGLLTNGDIKEENGEIIIKNEHLYNGCEYSSTLYHYLAKEYLDSALILAKFVLNEREKRITKDDIVLSSYVNPCAFLCRHAIELKLKQCLAEQNNINTNSHDLKKLWNSIDKEKLSLDIISQFDKFISEIIEIDPNGESIRYGTNKKALPIKEPVNYDCLALVSNAMYLFNQLHKIAF